MPTDEGYTISELATLAGVTPRTIRYYVSIGLLPAPAQAGPGTRYGAAHLARLRLIRRLQREHLPLGEVAARLQGLDESAIEAALDARVGAAPDLSLGSPPGSALEYIRRVKEAQTRTPPTSWRGLPTVAASAPAPMAPASPAAQGMPTGMPTPMRPTAGVEQGEPATTLRTQWERVTLGPNVELHIRRPLSRMEQRQVERLIRLGRELLEGGQQT
jgi:DNA-binding transcriptional MerR regulator